MGGGGGGGNKDEMANCLQRCCPQVVTHLSTEQAKLFFFEPKEGSAPKLFADLGNCEVVTHPSTEPV